MANGDFAMPVGHSTGSVSTIPVSRGEDFHQVEDALGRYSRGLTIGLNGTNDQHALYAMFNGLLHYVAELDDNNAIASYKIELKILPDTQKLLNNIARVVEPPPVIVIYGSADADGLRDYLIGFIRTLYNATTPTNVASWHPIMSQFWPNPANVTVRKRIADSGDVDGTIGALVDLILAGTVRPQVKAGEKIGYAFLPGAGWSNNGDANFPEPRGVTIYTKEYVGNYLSPAYYLWMLLRNSFVDTGNARQVNCITAVGRNTGTNTFTHPLLTALGTDLDVRASARNVFSMHVPGETDPQNVYLIPFGPFIEWHGADHMQRPKKDCGVKLTAAERAVYHDSPAEWRFNMANNEQIEAQIRQSNPRQNLFTDADVSMTPTTATRTQTNLIWTNYGDIANRCAYEFQVPVEFIIGIMQIESAAQGERALALEEIDGDTWATTNVPAGIQTRYNDLAPYYGISVPDPIVWTSNIPPRHIKTATVDRYTDTITWNELVTVLNAVNFRASPGLMQTMLKTAQDAVAWANRWFGDIADRFDLDPIPNNAQGWFEWLLAGNNSAFAGVAYCKFNYVNKWAAMDIVKQSSCYNAGSLYHTFCCTHGENNPWGCNFYKPIYPRTTGRAYNQMHTRVNNLTAGADGIYARAQWFGGTLP